jgi:hypothetical protein
MKSVLPGGGEKVVLCAMPDSPGEVVFPARSVEKIL